MSQTKLHHVLYYVLTGLMQCISLVSLPFNESLTLLISFSCKRQPFILSNNRCLQHTVEWSGVYPIN
jgi:hypothetical protein